MRRYWRIYRQMRGRQGIAGDSTPFSVNNLLIFKGNLRVRIPLSPPVQGLTTTEPTLAESPVRKSRPEWLAGYSLAARMFGAGRVGMRCAGHPKTRCFRGLPVARDTSECLSGAWVSVLQRRAFTPYARGSRPPTHVRSASTVSGGGWRGHCCLFLCRRCRFQQLIQQATRAPYGRGRSAKFVSSVASLRVATALLRGELSFSVPEDGRVPLWNAPRQVDLCQSACDRAIQ